MLFNRLIIPLLIAYSLNALANSAPWVGESLEGLPCDGGDQGFGPFDYSKRATIDKHNLDIVEGAHFTSKVEKLAGGFSGSLEGDLNYTLRAWPNHHRALLTIINYQLNIKNKLLNAKLKTPPECYLQRAVHFSPEDAATYSLYGYYLKKIGKQEDALSKYQMAMKLDPDDAKIAYSLSLLLIDMKKYDEAVKYAQIAYQQGKAPDGLKQKLRKLGIWKEKTDLDPVP